MAKKRKKQKSSSLAKIKPAAQGMAVTLAHEEIHEELRMVSGPLPDAASYAAYEATTPGAGERILAMAEKEQAHRHQIEDLLALASVEDMRKEHSSIVVVLT